MQNIKQNKYLRYLVPTTYFGTNRTKEILNVNPTIIPHREEAQEVFIFVYDYNGESIEEKKLDNVADCFAFKHNNRISWINIDGLRKADVETMASHFDIHPLLVEDILSINQRPKMEEMDSIMFLLLNMLYYNDENQTVEQEQISIVLGKDFVISFQEDATRDVFNPLRARIKMANSKIRQSNADYLCYAMIDLIVDNYFLVMEKLGERIELIEEEVIRRSDTESLGKINKLRKELIVLKRIRSPGLIR